MNRPKQIVETMRASTNDSLDPDTRVCSMRLIPSLVGRMLPVLQRDRWG